MAENSRWAAAVSVSPVFDSEQAQRAQALRIAREVCEQRESGSGPFTPGGTDAGIPWLVEIARWIFDGTTPEPVDLRMSEVSEP